MEQNIYAEGQVILIDKPLEWTSFDVVNKLKHKVKAKIGHAGTLDPLATGLLICCTGKMTKKINEYQAQEKEYTGTFTLGATTPTFDLESAPENFKDTSHLTTEAILEATKLFIGAIAQFPPIHSAIKQNGKPIYLAARKGVAVKVEPRQILIKEFEITQIDMPVVHFRVVCSTGTYIRSLANDFGAALGVGGYLSKLVRTRIGEFKVEDAYTLDAFLAKFNV
ncbi:tRNA pseudouridine synthase B [Chitinophaga costaii]|uniref:tRNA pseudouridine synthase B n=1 Tax=Chitinophaga costaii TaxID=1335309 RepID=A0A1C3ZQ86_9BACT|nr:tRNA pseudouridine(55) synthase TruB [Chitinophaga costaii]PUZ30464.1 tRNA pseudouridine(55) synthase TruB [Chitinophaga costaii]SCB84607.1 tRNA pseudouridine synthase B [Chitinophaga costaii]